MGGSASGDGGEETRLLLARTGAAWARWRLAGGSAAVEAGAAAVVGAGAAAGVSGWRTADRLEWAPAAVEGGSGWWRRLVGEGRRGEGVGVEAAAPAPAVAAAAGVESSASSLEESEKR